MTPMEDETPTCDVCGREAQVYRVYDPDPAAGTCVRRELECPAAYRHTSEQLEDSDYPLEL
jgi:hypothetical protein